MTKIQALTSCLILSATWGFPANKCIVQVSTAAVVSWPATSMVIKSSRSCFELISSPLHREITNIYVNFFWAGCLLFVALCRVIRSWISYTCSLPFQCCATIHFEAGSIMQAWCEIICSPANLSMRLCNLLQKAELPGGSIQWKIAASRLDSSQVCGTHWAIKKCRIDGSASFRNSSTNSSSSSAT